MRGRRRFIVWHRWWMRPDQLIRRKKQLKSESRRTLPRRATPGSGCIWDLCPAASQPRRLGRHLAAVENSSPVGARRSAWCARAFGFSVWFLCLWWWLWVQCFCCGRMRLSCLGWCTRARQKLTMNGKFGSELSAFMYSINASGATARRGTSPYVNLSENRT